MWEIESNADLLLINSYEALNNIRPKVPTTVYLGGIHQKAKPTPLPRSLSKFLDDSESVVYVNLHNAINQYPLAFKKLLSALENANVDIVMRTNEEYVNSTARIYQGNNFDQESVLGEITCPKFKKTKKTSPDFCIENEFGMSRSISTILSKHLPNSKTFPGYYRSEPDFFSLNLFDSIGADIA